MSISKFENANLAPLSLENEREIHKIYQRQGFAILENRSDKQAEAFIEIFRRRFGLGEYYHSNFNQQYHAANLQGNISFIGEKERGNHPAFNSSNHQDLHVDGTFDPISTVKTTLLYCEQNADKGGESLLFDAVGAFQTLQKTLPDYAKALMHKRALIRRSTMGTDDAFLGPAFDYQDGKIVTRFTLDPIARWEETYSEVPHLEAAVAAMKQFAQADSAYYLTFKLRAKQMIVFENDTLCHGRAEYFEQTQKRLMIRGLFRKRLVVACDDKILNKKLA